MNLIPSRTERVPALRAYFPPALWLLVAALLLPILGPMPCAATQTGEEGIALVRGTVAQLQDALRAQDPATHRDPAVVGPIVEQVVVPQVDIPYSGKLILGKHWRDADATQRQAFTDAYRKMLIRTYSIHASDYMDANVEVLSWAPLGTDEGRITVRTRVTRDNGKPPATVDYRLTDSNGQWRVFDAVVNGVSLVSTLRTAVDAEISRMGLPALIEQLQSGKAAPPPDVIKG